MQSHYKDKDVVSNQRRKWYLRLILVNRPCESYDDAKTVFGVEYENCQLSAIVHGYATDELETLRCFESTLGYSTLTELIALFVMLTLQGGSTQEIFSREDLQTAMHEDYLYE